ncbi:proteoglycan 4 isoform X3 [Leptopilina boulardi]|uniref:proteoglycan 4 isoform X3 n=1 Tax=Leptopilina boulardi TaxID=63433 RepID=UPI0021F61800|nr:proteoglycan 4 isoform X3 [Leptopilina boulardi]
MIGSFWNLCRACPSMPIDKLHSEYRSTYTWHEYKGPHQEAVVRRPPQAPSTKQANAKLQTAKSTEDENSEGPTLEPPLPRRKKCPELAYKTHEFITAADGGGIDGVDSNVVADKVREVTATSTIPSSQLSKAISRISTEYRLQFAWPRRQQLTNGDVALPVAAAGSTGPPRKSLSMGALKQGIQPGPVPVHRKRPGDIDHKREGAQASELEPLVTGNTMDTIDGVVLECDEHEENIPDLKITYRGKKPGRTVKIVDNVDVEMKKSQEKTLAKTNVMALRQLADEYKHRDWGCGLTREDEASLWKKVSSNHALNALSLASRSVTKEEKEKENTRKVAPTVTMPPAGRPSSVQTKPIHEILSDDLKADNDKAIARARRDFLIRHHLDRTTGIGDGALLPSPTREKLEPVIPRRRDDTKEHRDEIQPRMKSSPKNSPRTGRSQSLGPSVADRKSPKRQPSRTPSSAKDVKEKEKESKDKDKDSRERSGERERHPRPTTGSRVRWNIRVSPAALSTSGNQPIPQISPPPTSSGPRPTPIHRRSPKYHRKPFLATNAPPHRPLHHAKPITTNITSTTINTNATVKPSVKHSIHSIAYHPPTATTTTTTAAAAARLERVKHAQAKTAAAGATGHPPATAAAVDPSKSSFESRYAHRSTSAVQAMTAEPQLNGNATGGSSVASTPPSQVPAHVAPASIESPWFDDEPVIKSPPEPTRVKSPEQMIMRSPEPVNWTVPLDTGKTFTVTQNVREGDPLTRPHSEAKSWGPSSLPSAPQSAPPELAHLHKSQHSQQSGYKSPESESVSLGSFTGTNGHKDPDSDRGSPLLANVQRTPTPTKSTKNLLDDADDKQQTAESSIKPVAGTNLRCLDDPVFEFERKNESNVPTTTTMTATAPGQHGYHVLEATSPQLSGTGYHVLEAPISPGSSQRSAATDVLEMARNRFDKFWGKGPEN